MVTIMDSKLYYECHVTVEPVFDEQLANLKTIARSFGFRVASLLMQKRAEDSPERSKYDTFMTATAKNYENLQESMIQLIKALQVARYTVWRYKIVDTVIDSRIEDPHGLLK